jgi:hypothetical protein
MTRRIARRIVVFFGAVADLIIISHYFAVASYGCPQGLYSVEYCDAAFSVMCIEIIFVAILTLVAWLLAGRLKA